MSELAKKLAAQLLVEVPLEPGVLVRHASSGWAACTPNSGARSAAPRVGLGKPARRLVNRSLFPAYGIPQRAWARDGHHENVFHSRFLLDPSHALAKTPEPQGSSRPRMPVWPSFRKTDPSRAPAAAPGTHVDDRGDRHALHQSVDDGPCSVPRSVFAPADDTQSRRKRTPSAGKHRTARTTPRTLDNELNAPPRPKRATCLAMFPVMKDPPMVSTTETKKTGKLVKTARSSTFCSARRSFPISPQAANFRADFYGSQWSSRTCEVVSAARLVSAARGPR